MTTVYIPPICGCHEGSTVVLDGKVTHTSCPTLLEELAVLDIYPQADVSLCAVSVIEILKGWGSYYPGLRRTRVGGAFKSIAMDIMTPWDDFDKDNVVQSRNVFVAFRDVNTRPLWHGME